MKVWGLLLLCAVVGGQQSNINTVCRNVINSLDCRRFRYKPLCASDGRQYSTECDFTKAHCLNPGLHIINEGECPSGVTPQPTTAATTAATAASAGPTSAATTAATAGPTTVMASTMPTSPPATTGGFTGLTTDPNLTPVCNQIVNEPCDNAGDPLCATDGNTYDNYCLYNKRKCYAPALQVAYAGPCSSTDTFPPFTTVTTTPAPSVFDIICRTLEMVTCETTGVQVCASDGTSYPTACDFEKAKCQNPVLTLVTC